MKIYPSLYPPVHVPDESIFTFLFQTRFDEHSTSKTAYIDSATGKSVTRGELKNLALSVGWGLRNELPRLGGVSLTRDDVVMIFSRNSLAWPIMLFGGIAAGLRMTLANSAHTPGDLLYQWQDSGAKAMFVQPALLPVALEMFKLMNMSLTEARRRIIIADFGVPAAPSFKEHILLSDLTGKGRLHEEEKFAGDLAHETALLCYSSGTTGKSKGVESTHRNLTSILPMSLVALNSHLDSLPNQVALGVLPYYHIYGVIVFLMFSFVRGIPAVTMEKFDVAEFCKAIERYKVTEALVVPPISLALAHHPVVEKFNLKSLRLLISGAAPASNAVIKALRARLAKQGADVYVCQGYGLTETSPTTHYIGPEHSVRRMGSVGLLFPNLEARLVNDDVDEAKEGEPGELWVRGPTIMKGYLGNAEATKASITPDGWFKTGDIAVRDEEGFYYIVDRRKELIKFKGSQVPPAELENVLLQHPDIADAGVVGVYSEAEATELPRAYVVSKKSLQGAARTAFAKEVQEWVQGRVAKHKYLRGGVIVVNQIPKSEAGKILRRVLRDKARDEVAAESKTKAKL